MQTMSRSLKTQQPDSNTTQLKNGQMIGKDTSSQRINRWHIIIERWPASSVIGEMCIKNSVTHHNKPIRMAIHVHKNQTW